MTLAEASEIIRNLALIGAAPLGAVVALRGLNTWKSEAAWKKDAELAEELAVLMYRRRDAVKNIRNPVMLNRHLYTDERGQPTSDQELAEFLGYAKVYQDRMKDLSEILEATYPKQLLAKVRWGPKLEELTGRLVELENELARIVRANIRSQDPREGAAMWSDYSKLVKDEVLYEDDAENNQFSKDYQAAFSPIEEYPIGRLRKIQ